MFECLAAAQWSWLMAMDGSWSMNHNGFLSHVAKKLHHCTDAPVTCVRVRECVCPVLVPSVCPSPRFLYTTSCTGFNMYTHIHVSDSPQKSTAPPRRQVPPRLTSPQHGQTRSFHVCNRAALRAVAGWSTRTDGQCWSGCNVTQMFRSGAVQQPLTGLASASRYRIITHGKLG